MEENTLLSFDGVHRFKSVRRAEKRGHCIKGIPLKKRPFNNREETRGRQINKERKKFYEQTHI